MRTTFIYSSVVILNIVKYSYFYPALDRVALVYPNNDPINFICAFYGCLFAGVVPVPIEVPLTRRVSSTTFSFQPRTQLRIQQA